MADDTGTVSKYLMIIPRTCLSKAGKPRGMYLFFIRDHGEFEDITLFSLCTSRCKQKEVWHLTCTKKKNIRFVLCIANVFMMVLWSCRSGSCLRGILIEIGTWSPMVRQVIWPSEHTNTPAEMRIISHNNKDNLLDHLCRQALELAYLQTYLKECSLFEPHG